MTTSTGDFAEAAAKKDKTLDILVLGAGVMGQRHVASLMEVAEKVLKPQFGVTLTISAVDRSGAALAKLPSDVRTFKTLEEALAMQKPDAALMAFNDDQHIGAFRTLFSECPDLKAVLTEKPLTERLSEAREIEGELRKRYLSMNTVINFSPVFDRLKELMPEMATKYGVLSPLGFEAVWGKNRTADTRPSIGIPSESVHALSVVSDMFAQDGLALESGQAKNGYLSVQATDVVYEMDTVFRAAKTGLPMNFHASYVFNDQNRRVTAYYKTSSGAVLAAELEFDIKHNGKNADSLKFYEIDAATGKAQVLLHEHPDATVTGAEQGLLRNDRITAFISLSLIDFLTPPAKRSPEFAARLSNLDAALQVQGEVEQISADNPRLAVTRTDADPAKLVAPKYSRLSEASPEDVMGRIETLKRQTPVRTAKPANPSNAF